MLAKGADRAVRVWDDAFEGVDLLDVGAKTEILSAVVEAEDPDLVLSGVQAGDDSFGATGVSLAEKIGFQWGAVVNHLKHDLEDEVDDLETGDSDGILEQHKEVNQLEFELERKERERDDVEDEIASIEERLDDRDGLQSRREEVTEELTDLRTRIDQIEEEAVEEFNEHMTNLLETLEYENLDRIWIDRTTRDVREGRRKVTKSSFDLKIVRSTAEGAAYEDSIDHLSESEREVTGLVFALAGYLVHDVYETVPFMLLDSLEAIDSNRIAALVEYFESYAPYLVVALLEEDAQALEGDHEIISEI